MKQHKPTSQLSLLDQQQRWRDLPAPTRQRVVHDLARWLEEAYQTMKNDPAQPPTKRSLGNPQTKEPTHVTP